MRNTYYKILQFYYFKLRQKKDVWKVPEKKREWNGRAAGKDEIIGEMIKGGGYVMFPLRVVLCLKTGDLL